MPIDNKSVYIDFYGERIPKTSNYELATSKRYFDHFEKLIEAVKMRVVIHQIPNEDYVVIESVCIASGNKVLMWSKCKEFNFCAGTIRKVRIRLDRLIVKNAMDAFKEAEEDRLFKLTRKHAEQQ